MQVIDFSSTYTLPLQTGSRTTAEMFPDEYAAVCKKMGVEAAIDSIDIETAKKIYSEVSIIVGG